MGHHLSEQSSQSRLLNHTQDENTRGQSAQVTNPQFIKDQNDDEQTSKISLPIDTRPDTFSKSRQLQSSLQSNEATNSSSNIKPLNAKDVPSTAKRKNGDDAFLNTKRRSSSGSLKFYEKNSPCDEMPPNFICDAKSNSTNTLNFEIDSNCSNISEQINLVIRNAGNNNRKPVFKFPISSQSTSTKNSNRSPKRSVKSTDNSKTNDKLAAHVLVNPAYSDDEGVMTNTITNNYGAIGLTSDVNGSTNGVLNIPNECGLMERKKNTVVTTNGVFSTINGTHASGVSTLFTSNSSSTANTSSSSRHMRARPRLLDSLGALQFMCSCWKSAATCLKTSMQGT